MRFLTTAVAAAALSFAAPAFAADCVTAAEQKVAELDWQRDSNNVPKLYMEKLRVANDTCVSTKGKMGVSDNYTMRGLPAEKFSYYSQERFEELIKQAMPMQKLRAELGAEKFNMLLDFLDASVKASKDVKPLSAAAQPLKPPCTVPGEVKYNPGTSDEVCAPKK